MSIGKQVVISLVVLAAAVAVWARTFPPAAALLERAGLATPLPESASAADPDAEVEAPPLVTGAEVARATINDRVSAIGDGRAARSVTLTPYVSGRVTAIEVAAGDYVAAGTPLVRLDSEAEEIALDRARLMLDDARATSERNQELLRTRVITEVQLRESLLAVRQAELAIRDAELALDRRVIRAPFDGWVGILGVDVGDQVSTATEIATLDDRSHILVDFRVPERFVGLVKVGTPVTARPLARPGLELAGEVTTLDSRVSADTRTLRVRASLDNSDDLLRAGMAFSIGMSFPGDVYAAVDPLAIQWSAEGPYVWTAVDGRALRVPVQIVERNDDSVLVDADLPRGTMVVTQGQQMLRDGAPLRLEAGPTAQGGDAAPLRSRI